MTNSKRLLIVGLVMLSAACGVATFEAEPQSTVGVACPPLRTYTVEEQIEAADALAALGMENILRQFMDDYRLLREQCKPRP